MRFSPCLPRDPARRVRAILTTAAVAWLLATPFQNAGAASTQTPWRNLTPSQLTSVWWQWVFGIPVSISPLFDDSGDNAPRQQPYSDLLFLCGTYTLEQLADGDVVGIATRTINIKKGTALFFPVLNAESDNVCNKPHLGGNCFDSDKFPIVSGVPKLRALAASLTDPAFGLYATLTPTNSQFNPTGLASNVGYSRLLSPPFSFTLPKTDNLYQSFGINAAGTVAPGVADGYYSFVPASALPVGYYILAFGGSVPLNDQGDTFSLMIAYKITVTP